MGTGAGVGWGPALGVWGSHLAPPPRRATLICAWAEEGADAMGPGGELLHADACPPETLVDTLGAGDTFNAAVIFALSGGGHGPAEPGGCVPLHPPLPPASPLPSPPPVPRAEPSGRAQFRLPHRGQEVRDPGLRRHRLSPTCGCRCPPPRSLAPLTPLPIKFLGTPPPSLVPGPGDPHAPTPPVSPQGAQRGGQLLYSSSHSGTGENACHGPPGPAAAGPAQGMQGTQAGTQTIAQLGHCTPQPVGPARGRDP